MGVLATIARRREVAVDLFGAAGAFLSTHRLTPDPANYALAHSVVSDPAGSVALEVMRLTEGRLRLRGEDVVRLGGVAALGPAADVRLSEPDCSPAAEALVARTQVQVEGFRNAVHAMTLEAHGFGRDLAAVLHQGASPERSADIVQLASGMIARARLAESRLADATREADELRAALEEARGTARRDPLTDLPNRRAFDEAFAELDTEHHAPALVIADIDRFKQVNDQWGHAVGDRVLKVIGAALAEGCEGGFVARYGGEEFVMLFDSLPAARTMVEATRVRVAARRLRLRETEQPLGLVTFSAGITGVVPGEALEDALTRADAALYAAKQAGRNCVHEAPMVGA